MFDLSQLAPETLESVLFEVEELLTGPTERQGRSRVNYGYRSTDTFPAFNNLILEAATSSKINSLWTNEQTWQSVERVLQQVDDDDFQQPELLAAKILMGLRPAPGWEEFVPMPDLDKYKKSPLVAVQTLRSNSTVTFENSITLRRKYAAPLLRPGSTEESTFRKSTKHQQSPGPLRRVASRLLDAVLRDVSRSAVGDPPEAHPADKSSDELVSGLQVNPILMLEDTAGETIQDLASTAESDVTAQELVDVLLPRLVESCSALFREFKFLPATSLTEIEGRLGLLVGVRETLDRFDPSVFHADLPAIILQMDDWNPRKRHNPAVRRAEKFLRPGVNVRNIEKAIRAAHRQHVLWHRYCELPFPEVPVGLPQTLDLYKNVVDSLTLLFTGIELRALMESALEELSEHVKSKIEATTHT